MHKTQDSYQNIGRAVGALLLIGLILGVYNNLALLGPISFSSDFLTKAGTNSDAVITSVLLSLVTGLLSIAVSILLYEPFKQHGKGLAMAYFAFCILNFSFGIVDHAAVFALLSASNEFLQSGGLDAPSYKIVGNVIVNARELTHLIDILFGFLTYLLFFYLMLRGKLIPIFFIILGLLASATGATEMLLNLFGINHKWHMAMLLPMALCQILLSIWLIVKGFGNSAKRPPYFEGETS